MFDVKMFLATAAGVLMLLAPFVGVGIVSVWLEDRFGVPGYATVLLMVSGCIGIAAGWGVLK